MGVPAAGRIRTPCASSPTGKATVHPEESLRSGAPALEGHVLAGPYPQLVGLVALHLRERADIGARALTGPNLPAMAGYTPSACPTTPPRTGRYRRRSLGRPPPTCWPWRIQKTHQGDRNRGIVLPGYGSRRCAPPHPRAVVSRGRAPPSGATRRWVASPPSLRGRARGWSRYRTSWGKSSLVLERGESPGSPGGALLGP
jgi:hypothetical protein